MTPDEILSVSEHRPIPLESEPWIMRQNWNDLLFAHWPIATEKMRQLVPPQLELDLLDGEAWVAVTPFHMDGIRWRALLAVPGTNAFPELNVRTYVRHNGVPGVFFFSLDAASLLAVCGARIFFSLPYFHATMKAQITGREVAYSSSRKRGEATLRATYRGSGDVRVRDRSSREYFLTERYRLYALRGTTVMAAGIHHVPWSLEDASAEFEVNTMAKAAGIELPDLPPLLHFAKKLEVLIWPLRRA